MTAVMDIIHTRHSLSYSSWRRSHVWNLPRLERDHDMTPANADADIAAS
jgi:hypothetical protein